MNYILLGLLVIVLVALGVGGVQIYLKSRPPKEEPHLTFRCPHCGRKFHYRASRSGHRGVCPICKRTFFFPELTKKPAGPGKVS
jgi:hypothetical protein